jgi:hypothetical protein
VAMTVNLAIELGSIVLAQEKEQWPPSLEVVANSQVCSDLGLTAGNLETLMSHAERVTEAVKSLE